MDFTPHTDDDLQVMLGRLGLDGTAQLFEHLPRDVLLDEPLDVGDGMSEFEVRNLFDVWGIQNSTDLVCFAGGGFYDHYLSPTVQALTALPEFVTAYTPYQAEVSQGMLQALFEYQSTVSAITDMEITNASMYDGATAAAEAVNAAVLATRRRTVWVSRGLSPRIRETIDTFATARDLIVVEHPMVGGRTAWAPDIGGEPPAAVLWAQPNYLGVVEDYDTAVRVAKDAGAFAIVSYDPMTLGVLRSPGSAGVDIAVGEGQPLGNPLSFGGPGLGLFSIRREHVRKMPGRIIGKTVDRDGQVAYVMTLRAREQDIRRSKASSNICSNQALNAVAAGIQLAWLGPEGLREVGQLSAHKAHYLAGRLVQLPDVHLAVESAFVREFPIMTPLDARDVVTRMAERGYLAGIPLGDDYPEFPGGLLVAVTEQRTREELDGYVEAVEEVLHHD